METKQMFDIYDRFAGAHEYILGFAHKGSIYMAERHNTELLEMLKTDRASSKRGGYETLRFRPTAGQKFEMLANAIELCTVEYFEQRIESCIYNKGEVFEALVTEHFGQTWVKDNVPFTEAGDINVNGVEIQIKFEQATFATQPQLAKLLG